MYTVKVMYALSTFTSKSDTWKNFLVLMALEIKQCIGTRTEHLGTNCDYGR